MQRTRRRDLSGPGGLRAATLGFELRSLGLRQLSHARVPFGPRLRRDPDHAVDVQLLRPEAFAFQVVVFRR